METQKTSYIPTVNGVPVSGVEARNSFNTDPIEFPYSIPWSIQIYSPEGNFYPALDQTKIAVLCSNTTNISDAMPLVIGDTTYAEVYVLNGAGLVISNSYFGPRYMFISYLAAGSEDGNITFKLSK